MGAIELVRSTANASGVRAVARMHIANAVELLSAEDLADPTIHAARKELRRARAALRLLRDSLGESAFERENATLRDAAQRLGDVRDSRVTIDTLGKIVAGERSGDASTEGLKRTLLRDHARIQRAAVNGPLRHQGELLTRAYRRATRWHLQAQGWGVIGAGLKRTYRNGRKALASVTHERSTQSLHELRKQAKYLWYQLQILHPLWPGLGEGFVHQAHKLADHLGDDHDLTLLRSKVLDRASAAHPSGSLIELIDASRTELQDRSIVLAGRLYEEKPKDFVARVHECWRDWRGNAPH